MVFEVQDLASASPATVSRYVVSIEFDMYEMFIFKVVVWFISIQTIFDGVHM
jgi:hypothetical protein